MIRTVDLHKRFGETDAVNNLSFSVARGEIFGIVGPDGAGKSTLLRLLAGILEQSSGSIEVMGKDIFKDRYGLKENLAYMPQRFGLYEDLTVEENIYFFGRLFGLSRKAIIERIPALYSFSKLGAFSDRLAGKLSGGMKQKLGLACCLVHSPGLILLDEPTNGVDPVSRREFWKILYDLLADGVTIVVTTAYLDEAERCNRVAMMHNGTFITSGSPAGIKSSIGGTMLEIMTDNVWDCGKYLEESGRFRNIIREGSSIKVFVAGRDKGMTDIKKILAGKNIRVHGIRESAPSLENCFMEITSSGEGE
ncbi:MAG TPA: ABC transporter ATP-binding protein [Spirochaetota bacterium]|nr:ABC transporter ATP-binding protein [Spirochaetota bacterium]